jgi:putative hemolysin
VLAHGIRRLLAGLIPASGQSAASKQSAQIVSPAPPALLKAEIEALPAGQHLLTSGQFVVCHANASQIPWCLHEIGRLRELTFRAAGEGTGRSCDIDLYDAYYVHLFVWDAQAQMLVGAYRLGLADQILARYGKAGLYTQSLFKYRSRLLHALNPAIELGRSFVRAEYQRSFAPLVLLWRGIGQFISRSPNYAVLFGPVSISDSYAPVSRTLIVDYLNAHRIDAELARYVKPRYPFHGERREDYYELDLSSLRDIDEVSRLIESIESDSKGVPILLKHYLKLGGRVLGFSADHHFSNALDGLIVVDLRHSDSRLLARYMGEQAAADFLAFHAARGFGTDAAA